MQFKKHLKYVSTCGAVLLSLAPIMPLTSVVHAADTKSTITSVDNGSTDVKQEQMSISVKDIDVASGTPTFTPSYTNKDVDLKGFGNGFTINKLNPVVNIYKTKDDATNAIKNESADATKTVKANEKLDAGTTYYEVSEVVLNVPKPNEKYKINNGIQEKEYTSDDNSLVTIPVLVAIHARDSKISGNPFFVNNQNVAYADNQTVNASESIPNGNGGVVAPNSIKNITEIINSMGIKAYKGSNSNDDIFPKATEDSVKEQLNNAKITVSGDGTVTIPSGGFTYQLTAENKDNGKKSTLNIFFNGSSSNWDNYPLIRFGKVNVMQGNNNFNEAPVVIVNLRDKDWQTSVIKQFSAVQSSNNQTQIELKPEDVASSTIDTSKTGLYQAMLKATNENGETTYLPFNIAVSGSRIDETVSKTVVNHENALAKTAPTYEITNGKATEIKDGSLKVNSPIVVYKDKQTIGQETYVRVFKEGQKREATNIWINVKDVTKTPDVITKQGVTKKLMHAAYIYAKDGKRVGKSVIKSYSYVQVVYGQKVRIGKHDFYRLANSNNYIKCGNIDPTYRTIKRDAYIYTLSGKHATKKYKQTLRLRNGKKETKNIEKNLFYNFKKSKNKYVATYGAPFEIKLTERVGKNKKMTTHTVKMYRVGENRYVKASDFKYLSPKAENSKTQNTNSNTIDNSKAPSVQRQADNDQPVTL